MSITLTTHIQTAIASGTIFNSKGQDFHLRAASTRGARAGEVATVFDANEAQVGHIVGLAGSFNVHQGSFPGTLFEAHTYKAIHSIQDAIDFLS